MWAKKDELQQNSDRKRDTNRTTLLSPNMKIVQVFLEVKFSFPTDLEQNVKMWTFVSGRASIPIMQITQEYRNSQWFE